MLISGREWTCTGCGSDQHFIIERLVTVTRRQVAECISGLLIKASPHEQTTEERRSTQVCRITCVRCGVTIEPLGWTHER